MSTWPAITEPSLLERLAMGEEDFLALGRAWIARFPARAYEASALERALGYPWSRPECSCLLSGARVELLDDMAAPSRDATVQRFVSSDGEARRWPLLAFGSNASPGVLTQRFGDLPDGRDRDVLVLAGRLHDFDVGAAAHPTVHYAAMPATLFPSAGTTVNAAVLWVTAAQFARLTGAELPYRVGVLETHFEAEDAALSLNHVLAFVSRFGAFCLDGRPVALAAIPAAGRAAVALSQEQLLQAAAELAIGPGATPEMLVRAIFETLDEIAPKLEKIARVSSQPFVSDRWTPYPIGNA